QESRFVDELNNEASEDETMVLMEALLKAKQQKVVVEVDVVETGVDLTETGVNVEDVVEEGDGIEVDVEDIVKDDGIE
ncbi:11414_t:CDS:2, partial [Racocetra fulgida]